MIPLYSSDQFNSAKSITKLPCECENCGNTYYKPKKEITYALKKDRPIRFCSNKCRNSFYTLSKNVFCKFCNIEFTKINAEIKKSQNHFCSLHCAGMYNSRHRTKGTTRSKLEIWLEEQLTKLYPNLIIDYNQTSAIQSELDIYIPSLSLAFELNGIFHYEPIFGIDKLNRIQSNDQNKYKACLDTGIDLCIIDTSTHRYFKEKYTKKYLDIIINIINQRTLLTS